MDKDRALTKLEREYMENVTNNAWSSVFHKIDRDGDTNRFLSSVASKSHNLALNRYRDVKPYDHSRVLLKRIPNDYINANTVTVEKANRSYILTQGPLSGTVGHFWLMVWEQNSKGILMLNKIIEKSEVKCFWYWPDGNGPECRLVLKDVNLTVEQTHTEDFKYYCIRYFKLTDQESGGTRDVIQFHYTTWPDFGVPSSPVAFLDFLDKVRAAGVLEDDVGPAVVHCSAGIGRSGTFCLVDVSLVLIERFGVDTIDIHELLVDMRKSRMGLIQATDQLRFSYEAIIEGMLRRLADEAGAARPREMAGMYEIPDDAQDDVAPPPPPPRVASLVDAPPARPLPAIPTSISLGNMSCDPPNQSSSESDLNPLSLDSDTTISSADDEDEEQPPETEPYVANTDSSSSGVRRRRSAQDRSPIMKRKPLGSETWAASKRLKSKDMSGKQPQEDLKATPSITFQKRN